MNMFYIACFLLGCTVTVLVALYIAYRKQWPYEPKACPFKVIKGGEYKEPELQMFENTIEGIERNL